MIYEWKDQKSGKVVEVQRSVADRDIPPEYEGEWARVVSKPNVPFEQLRDRGVFERHN